MHALKQSLLRRKPKEVLITASGRFENERRGGGIIAGQNRPTLLSIGEGFRPDLIESSEIKRTRSFVLSVYYKKQVLEKPLHGRCLEQWTETIMWGCCYLVTLDDIVLHAAQSRC